jgi:hypothetical protein
MINNSLQYMWGRVNSNPLFGQEPGKLLIVEYYCGGGFAGKPQSMRVAILENDATATYGAVVFPDPSADIEYTFGGNLTEHEIHALLRKPEVVQEITKQFSADSVQ